MYAFAYTHVCNHSMYIFVLCILYSCVGHKSDEDEQIIQAVVIREAKRKVHTYVYYILNHSHHVKKLVICTYVCCTLHMYVHITCTLVGIFYGSMPTN